MPSSSNRVDRRETCAGLPVDVRHPIGDDTVAVLVHWLRRLRGGSDQGLIPQDRPATVHGWVIFGSYSSAALGAMYAHLLERAGIPVLRREWGGGSAMLGGVPVGVNLLVPQERLAEAKEFVGGDEAEREVGS